MKQLSRKLGIFAVLALAMTASPVSAKNVIGLDYSLQHGSEWVFGFSGYDGAEILTLTFADESVVTLNTDGRQGWWSGTNPNDVGNTNYFAGDLFGDGSALLNNFFVFDISGISSATVVSAVLSVTQFDVHTDTGRTEQIYTLHDVSTPVDELLPTVGTNAAIYADLGSGVSYGSFAVPLGNSFDPISFALNAAAVADINAAIAAGGADFAVGGSIPPAVSAVPEPSTVFMAGLAGLGVARRRRRLARA